MTKAEANQKVTKMFGPESFATRVSSKDRNQRFGIVMVNSGRMYVVGFGSSYEEAFQMAEKEVNKATQTVEKETNENS